jgi:hypothetical protein
MHLKKRYTVIGKATITKNEYFCEDKVSPRRETSGTFERMRVQWQRCSNSGDFVCPEEQSTLESFYQSLKLYFFINVTLYSRTYNTSSYSHLMTYLLHIQELYTLLFTSNMFRRMNLFSIEYKKYLRLDSSINSFLSRVFFFLCCLYNISQYLQLVQFESSSSITKMTLKGNDMSSRSKKLFARISLTKYGERKWKSNRRLRTRAKPRHSITVLSNHVVSPPYQPVYLYNFLYVCECVRFLLLYISLYFDERKGNKKIKKPQRPRSVPIFPSR